ncbi:MAG: DEAD/DEAH box helicase [Verrucomicrobia bacterium]|nr:DEAD/DEAH box helicase [Verrucomicrobiota bacterium]
MDNAFELLDPRTAQAFLKQFSADARRKGEACFRRGAVQDLVPEKPGVAYSARVKDGELYVVDLEYDPTDGWLCGCSCPQEFDCEHILAAMRALLAEHSAAAVRTLSGSGPSASATLAAARSKPAAADSSELVSRLVASRNRQLKAEERKFLGKVHGVYARCRQVGHITHWDFEEMGLRLGGYGWDALPIWPSVPENDYLFWLYVANAAKERQVVIPEFMQPITDLSAIRDHLARWARERQVQTWQQKLSNLQIHGGQPQAVEQAYTDLRVLIDEKGIRLQWFRPGQPAFDTIKQPQLQQFTIDYEEGRIRLTSEAELIWQFFSHRAFYGMAVQMPYRELETARVLGRLLRIRQLDSRIVSQTGEPLARPTEPLRWELTPATGEDDDYRLRLTQADGTPPPPILCTLPSLPALYLTPTAVFTGPAPRDRVLDPQQENRIPAPAIEQSSGVAFLQSLGTELPPRIRDRVRTLPYEIVIQCDLQPSYHGSNLEDCLVDVVAEAPDGQRLSWVGSNWLQQTPASGRRKRREQDFIDLYDTALLELVPRLLEPLNLRPVPYGEGRSLRVTKKFPELFAAWLKSVPPQITVKLGGDLASFTTDAVAGRVKLDVTEGDIDWFDLRVVLDVSDTTLTQEEIKLLLNAKGAYVRLEGKGWRRLQYDLSADENERLARLGLSPRELSAAPQRLHALQLADEAAKKFLPEQQVEQIKRRVGEIKARVAPDLPSGVTAQLRPYQLEGFHFLAYLSTNRFGGILADDMGLGKTLQTLAWLLWLREQHNAPPVPGTNTAEGESSTVNAPTSPPTSSAVLSSLVVCPKSVMDNWHAEAAQFTPGLRVKLWSGSDSATLGDRLGEADLHVLNYAQLRLAGEGLCPVRWLAVILDEGQYIKNPNSQTAQVARALRAEHRLVLTGTPIENRLLDLWSLMTFAMPGVMGSRAHFARIYDSKDDPFGRRRLSARVRPFLLRRTKAQVAKDLPDRIEEDLFCEIEGEQKTLYRAELKRAQQLLLAIKTQKELAEQQFHFLVSLLRLRQICCHPRLIKADSVAPSAKTEALLEQLEPMMDEGQKVLVFSQFVEMLDLLRPALEERKWPLFYLSGQTENRGDLVRQFQTTDGPAIFLISLKAGGFGLNLTAASYVVLFDPWWNPAVENQAIDRTHRIGQVNKVIAYRLLIKDSIEEKIRVLQRQKKALAEDVLGEERFAQSLTLQDLRFLFAD